MLLSLSLSLSLHGHWHCRTAPDSHTTLQRRCLHAPPLPSLTRHRRRPNPVDLAEQLLASALTLLEHRHSIQAEREAEVFVRALRSHSGSSSWLVSSIATTMQVQAWRRNFVTLSRFSSLRLDSFKLSFNTIKNLNYEFYLFICNFICVMCCDCVNWNTIS